MSKIASWGAQVSVGLLSKFVGPLSLLSPMQQSDVSLAFTTAWPLCALRAMACHRSQWVW